MENRTSQFRPDNLSEQERRLVYFAGTPEAAAGPETPEAQPEAQESTDTPPTIEDANDAPDAAAKAKEQAEQDLQHAKDLAAMVEQQEKMFSGGLGFEEPSAPETTAEAPVQPTENSETPPEGSAQENLDKAGEKLEKSGMGKAAELAMIEFAKALEAALQELVSYLKGDAKKEGEKTAEAGSETEDGKKNEEKAEENKESSDSKGKLAEVADVLGGKEASPEAQKEGKYTDVQNPKLELKELPSKEEELEKKYKELGDQMDAIEREAGEDSTKEHRDQVADVQKDRDEVSKQLDEIEGRKEGLEKEQERREALVKNDWNKALEGAPEADKRFVQNVELGGDGDDLVITLQKDFITKDMEKALNALGGITVDSEKGTLSINDLPPGEWAAEGPQATARQKVFETLARVARVEKQEEKPADTVAQAEKPAEQAAEKLSESAQKTDAEWQGIESLVDAHGENPDMLSTLDADTATRMKAQLEQFVGVVDAELASKPDGKRMQYISELKDQAQHLIARIDAMPRTEQAPTETPEAPANTIVSGDATTPDISANLTAAPENPIDANVTGNAGNDTTERPVEQTPEQAESQARILAENVQSRVLLGLEPGNPELDKSLQDLGDYIATYRLKGGLENELGRQAGEKIAAEFSPMRDQTDAPKYELAFNGDLSQFSLEPAVDAVQSIPTQAPETPKASPNIVDGSGKNVEGIV